MKNKKAENKLRWSLSTIYSWQCLPRHPIRIVKRALTMFGSLWAEPAFARFSNCVILNYSIPPGLGHEYQGRLARLPQARKKWHNNSTPNWLSVQVQVEFDIEGSLLKMQLSVLFYPFMLTMAAWVHLLNSSQGIETDQTEDVSAIS